VRRGRRVQVGTLVTAAGNPNIAAEQFRPHLAHRVRSVSNRLLKTELISSGQSK
jgi:hypothetical protein